MHFSVFEANGAHAFSRTKDLAIPTLLVDESSLTSSVLLAGHGVFTAPLPGMAGVGSLTLIAETVEEQQATKELESKVAKQELTATQKQKQIEALSATVRRVRERGELRASALANSSERGLSCVCKSKRCSTTVVIAL